jgi:ribosomal protein S27E
VNVHRGIYPEELTDKMIECRMYFMRITCPEVKDVWVWFGVSSLKVSTLRSDNTMSKKYILTRDIPAT